MQRRKLFRHFFNSVFFSRLKCDVNINNITGIRNTDLLRFYAETDERVAPLSSFRIEKTKLFSINRFF